MSQSWLLIEINTRTIQSDHYQLSAQVNFGNCILYQYLIVFLIMKVALSCFILSLAFLAIFSAESAGKKESLQNVHNKRALSHKADKRKAVNKRKLKKSLKNKTDRSWGSCLIIQQHSASFRERLTDDWWLMTDNLRLMNDDQWLTTDD